MKGGRYRARWLCESVLNWHGWSTGAESISALALTSAMVE